MMRYLEEALIRRLADPLWVDRIVQVWKLLQKNVMAFASGVVVRGIVQRLSGEPFTSLMNFVFNLFHSWMAWSRTRPTDEFWSNIDQLFIEGDDKLDGLSSTEDLVSAAESLGLVLKVEYEGILGLAPFLGRVNVPLPHGVTSCCDFWRTMTKFHLSASNAGEMNRAGLARAKGLSYMATDYHTPGIGALAWLLAKQNAGAIVDTSIKRVVKNRMVMSGIGWEDLSMKPPPKFDLGLANIYGLQCGVSISNLRRIHDSAVSGVWPLLVSPIKESTTGFLPVVA